MGAPVLAASTHAMAAVPATHDEEANQPVIVQRVTRGKRMLWYCLKVIQQPERARACGSGPKSSADRRPVDPPPVVELRIYEGETWERAQNKDITFLYNANFFLYATLEHARVMAHGRVQTPAANSPPVLTGMPVSGMAYLDRPQEAGYFLFPDLSVRHEGRYKLTFNLYEETKEEDDKDMISGDSKAAVQDVNPATGGSFDFRMEVKSRDFVVYSAKKFPGLTESTALSRVVAEQGCRVRIRRDVRMRRRDGKGGGGAGSGDYDNGEPEYPRRRTATPDRPDPYRARSLSGSTERPAYPGDPQRRPSIADYPPQFPSQPSSAGGHLQFLGGNSNPQYPPQPQPYSQQSSSVPASPVYPPSQNPPYASRQSYLPPPKAPAPPFYSHEQRTPAQPYMPPIGPSPRRESGPENRGPSSNITLPPITTSHPPLHENQLPPKLPSIPSLPSIEIGEAASRLPLPSPSPTFGRAPSSFPAPGSLPAPQYRAPPPQYAGTKRARDESFRPDDTNHRYQDGARDPGNTADSDASQMVYRRANGDVWAAPMPTETN